jgi:signal transduction histidine kinase/ActR/RegA family two-component response regulator
MNLSRVSLGVLAKFLSVFCLSSLLLLIFSALAVNGFFDKFRESSLGQAELSQSIAQELNQKLLPINNDLAGLQLLFSQFTSELELLSVDIDRDFDRLEEILGALENTRGSLVNVWPNGLLDSALLERIISSIIISEDIAIEVLEKRSPNYTYQLYEESVDIIETVRSDAKEILDAVHQKLTDLAAESLASAKITQSKVIAQQAELKLGVAAFVVISSALFALLMVFIWLFSRETNRRLHVLKRFAQAVESGDYKQSVNLLANDSSGELARSLESMSERLVELIQESEQLAEDAEQSSIAKSEFLASMSHEIRTPMNGVIGLLDILSASKLDAQQKHYLKLAQSSASSLLSLINDILDFSKIESGKLALENIDYSLSELLSDFVDVMSHTAAEKGLVLMYQEAGLGHGWITGDAGRLRQVLTNLVGNALKFTDKGEVTLGVELTHENGKNTLLLSVSDTGIGIAEDKIASLFESFTQADASTTRKYGGTGLGLTISNQLVALMGADSLQVESQLGKGSRFFFEIEVDMPDAPQVIEVIDDTQVQEDDVKGAREQLQQKMRVLLVEDNPVNQIVAQTLVEAEGYEVEIAGDGQQAIDKLNGGDFCLVLMDCQMPVMDGYDATRNIREGACGESTKTIPVIAMTANAMQGDKEKCLDSGMDDYISKPIDAEILKQRLEHWSKV